MENKDNRNLEEEMDTASEAKAGEETAEAPRTEETADADTDSSEGNGEGGDSQSLIEMGNTDIYGYCS